MKTFDVIIIGAGTAGLAARKQVAKQTDKYLVIDHGPLGTTCTRVGCMPSKALIEAANIYHKHVSFSKIGATTHSRLDSIKFMKHVRKLRDHYVRSVKDEMLPWKSKLVTGTAGLVSKSEILVEGKTYRAKRIIIATGSHPVMPEPWKSLELLTTDSIFDLRKLPKTLAIIGSGPIGLELGQALARVGVQVTIFGEEKSIGGLSDPKIIECVIRTLKKEFQFVAAQVKDISHSRLGFRIVSRKKSGTFEQVLVAVGRKPNLKALRLENLHVDLDETGLPHLTAALEVRGTNVSFAGDVNMRRPLLHEAAYQGFAEGQKLKPRKKTKLAITFCTPNICLVGESHKELTTRKKKFVTGAASFENQGRAVTKLENAGLIHVYAEQKTGILLGAEIFCPEGEHLAHLLAWAMEAGLTISQILEFPFYHPTLEEGLRTALQRAR